ncbi:hypothetical protein [Nocardioides sp. B-3]|uniref:hypothetical protein n=1 Tax=Nocardioides sp. B-3 TaxID=2895565 RepID=UPI00215259A6|nr:hypothetical protein [Nocardioides sp. B-3]UUZ58001.1 hypothetical protein LP418_16930 [Nocardioides sp. B-3]
MADWSIFRSLLIGAVGMGATLMLFWLTAPGGWLALPVVFLITALGSGARGQPAAAVDGRRR